MSIFAKRKNKIDLNKTKLIEKFRNMSTEQLIIALLIDHDAAHNQALYDSPLGDESIKRCGYNPYTFD
jgi:hypothetical protein